MCLNRSSDCSLQVSHDENSRMYFHLPARSLPAVYLHVRVRQRTSVFVQVIRFIRLTAPISVSGYRQFGQLNFDKLASDAKRGRAAQGSTAKRFYFRATGNLGQRTILWWPRTHGRLGCFSYHCQYQTISMRLAHSVSGFQVIPCASCFYQQCDNLLGANCN